jgi:hypothetical protein
MYCWEREIRNVLTFEGTSCVTEMLYMLTFLAQGSGKIQSWNNAYSIHH